MNRMPVAFAVFGLVAAAGCSRSERAQPSPRPSGSESRDGDCSTLLATATITLRKPEGGGKCQAAVDPKRIRVQRGGTVRWFVDNRCRTLEAKRGHPVLAVVDMKSAEAGIPQGAKRGGGRPGWFEKACKASLDRVELGSPHGKVRDKRPPLRTNVILCGIPEEKELDGVYDYRIAGSFEELDPRLEVIEPHP